VANLILGDLFTYLTDAYPASSSLAAEYVMAEESGL